MTPIEEIKYLIDEIEHHNYQYHTLDNPLIEDHEYDQLFQRLLKLEKDNPSLSNTDSPTNRVGGELNRDLREITHSIPMISLDNVFSVEEAINWYRKLPHLSRVIGEPKLDGLALSVTYVNGKMVSAATRGDGSVGESVIHNALTIKNLPEFLKYDFPEYEITVRGEVVMSKVGFMNYNKTLVADGLKPLANARNGAAGAMRKKDSVETAKRPLSFVAYEVLGDLTSDHVTSMERLGEMGFTTTHDLLKPEVFPTNEYTECLDEKQVVKLIAAYEQYRSHFPYDIDGIVFKVCDYYERNKLGATSRVPRWATAYKFPPDAASSKLLSVDFQVGRTGAITPVARIEPVYVGGTTVSNVTLHNADELVRKDIREGCNLIVVRAGDVIPQIRTAISDPVNPGKPIEFPTHCPDCNTRLIKDEDAAVTLCPNRLGCRAQLVMSLFWLGSRKAFDIDGLGEVTCEKLISSGLVKTLDQLFTLTVEDLLTLDGFGRDSAQSLYDNIMKQSVQPLHKFIYGLGILGVGEDTSRRLAEHYGHLNLLRHTTYVELTKIPDIGPLTAMGIMNYLQGPATNQTIDNMLAAGVVAIPCNKVEGGLTGSSFCFTGSFPGYVRTELQDKVRLEGGKVSSSISKGLTYLVAGDNAGTKVEKAQSVEGVKILSLEEFIALL